jgi:pyruvate formate lyase activating enzyme
MTGRIHAIETMGALDGPGIRCVVFLQGCPMRCQYCHNPDTWDPAVGSEMTVAEILKQVSRMKPYFGKSGGITLSGGEPLLQPDFAADLLRACRAVGIHTALDTSGFAPESAHNKVLPETDLVLLDIKHTDPVRHKELTGQNLDRVFAFMDKVAEGAVPLWIRQVIVPGWNDTAADMAALAKLTTRLPTLARVELLPYHRMAEEKWQALGLAAPLPGVDSPDAATLARLRAVLYRRLELMNVHGVGHHFTVA